MNAFYEMCEVKEILYFLYFWSHDFFFQLDFDKSK